MIRSRLSEEYSPKNTTCEPLIVEFMRQLLSMFQSWEKPRICRLMTLQSGCIEQSEIVKELSMQPPLAGLALMPDITEGFDAVQS